MTTNETSFFRDKSPFDALKELVLPQLLSKKSASEPVRIWCAACSSGQEPYSLAIMLREEFPELVDRRIEIIASDLSNEVLARARQGKFGQFEVARGLSQAQLSRFFQRTGTDWQLKDEIRRMIQFSRINLIGSWPKMPPLDIVLLRNVLIYFDVATKQQILGRVCDVLTPDGYLFLGAAETPVNLCDSFQRVDFPRAGCYRRGRPDKLLRTAHSPAASNISRPVTT